MLGKRSEQCVSKRTGRDNNQIYINIRIRRARVFPEKMRRLLPSVGLRLQGRWARAIRTDAAADNAMPADFAQRRRRRQKRSVRRLFYTKESERRRLSGHIAIEMRSGGRSRDADDARVRSVGGLREEHSMTSIASNSLHSQRERRVVRA